MPLDCVLQNSFCSAGVKKILAVLSFDKQVANIRFPVTLNPVLSKWGTCSVPGKESANFVNNSSETTCLAFAYSQLLFMNISKINNQSSGPGQSWFNKTRKP